METELCVCIDSDDYMPDDAVEKILACWRSKGSKEMAGIIGLDFLIDNTPLGGYFPEIDRCHLYDLSFKYHHACDTKEVIRVDLLKEVFPQPTYNNEKNFNPSYMFKQVDLHYEWLILNENLCYVDYQPDGMASAIFKQYTNSPNSFAAQRINNLNLPAPFLFRLKQYVHLGSSIFLSGNYSWISKAPKPWITIALMPFAWFLSLYIRLKARN